MGGELAARRYTRCCLCRKRYGLLRFYACQLRQDGLPASTVERGALPETLTQLLTDAGMAASGKQVKDALGRSAVTINGHALGWDDNARVGDALASERARFGRYYLAKLGKKKYHLFELA